MCNSSNSEREKKSTVIGVICGFLFFTFSLHGYTGKEQPVDTVDYSRIVVVVCGNVTVITNEAEFEWEGLADSLLAPTLDSGYAYASISVERSAIKGDTLFLFPVVDSGYVVEITSLGFAGSFQTRPGLLSHLTGFRPFRYSPVLISELQKRLEEEGCAVDDWEIILNPNVVTAAISRERKEDSLEAVQPVILNLLVSEEHIPNRVHAAVGYSDEGGFTGSADILVANPFGGRREIALSWRRIQAHNLTYSLGLKDPYIFRLPFGVAVSASFRSYDTLSYHFGAGIEAFFDLGQGEVGLGYAYEGSRADTVSISKNLATTRLSTSLLELNIKAGERRAHESSVYLYARAKAYMNIPLFWLFSIHAEPNAALVASKDSLAALELIPVGGAGTLRGYAEEEFRASWTLFSRQELRWGTEQFYLYPLADVGWIADEGLVAGYGAGLSLLTPIGLVKLDAALPLDGTWNRAKLHMSMGVDF